MRKVDLHETLSEAELRVAMLNNLICRLGSNRAPEHFLSRADDGSLRSYNEAHTVLCQLSDRLRAIALGLSAAWRAFHRKWAPVDSNHPARSSGQEDFEKEEGQAVQSAFEAAAEVFDRKAFIEAYRRMLGRLLGEFRNNEELDRSELGTLWAIIGPTARDSHERGTRSRARVHSYDSVEQLLRNLVEALMIRQRADRSPSPRVSASHASRARSTTSHAEDKLIPLSQLVRSFASKPHLYVHSKMTSDEDAAEAFETMADEVAKNARESTTEWTKLRAKWNGLPESDDHQKDLDEIELGKKEAKRIAHAFKTVAKYLDRDAFVAEYLTDANALQARFENEPRLQKAALKQFKKAVGLWGDSMPGFEDEEEEEIRADDTTAGLLANFVQIRAIERTLKPKPGTDKLRAALIRAPPPTPDDTKTVKTKKSWWKKARELGAGDEWRGRGGCVMSERKRRMYAI